MWWKLAEPTVGEPDDSIHTKAEIDWPLLGLIAGGLADPDLTQPDPGAGSPPPPAPLPPPDDEEEELYMRPARVTATLPSRGPGACSGPLLISRPPRRREAQVTSIEP
jgi:hypothetical protein